MSCNAVTLVVIDPLQHVFLVLPCATNQQTAGRVFSAVPDHLTFPDIFVQGTEAEHSPQHVF